MHLRLGGHRPGLHLPGWADLGHLQRGAPVLHDRPGLCAPGVLGPQGRGRLVGAQGKTHPRGDGTGVRARHLDPFLGPPGKCLRQPDGRGLVRHGRGPGLRAELRLLVHGLLGRPARHGCQQHERRPAHALDRRRAQDALPGPGHPAGHDRHRHPAYQRGGVPAPGRRRQPRLQHDHPRDASRATSRRGSWASASRP